MIGEGGTSCRVAGVARYTPTGDWYIMFLIRFRNSALRAALVICILPHIAPTGRRALSAAACYALRRKAHNESMRKDVSPLNPCIPIFCRGVACFRPYSALRAAYP